ncbi:MAG: hypothetical protein LC802_07460 [Acidobacteria bacterium]|nr:hypothetical protein [Acidobacteriota bacterium]
MSIETPSQESFAENLNTKFRLPVQSGAPLELELIEVAPGLPREGTERFSLVFRGALNLSLPQSTYRLEHERLGALDIFLVPIAREADGFRYEAVFNRFVTKPEGQ